jgi:hypothetical protein
MSDDYYDPATGLPIGGLASTDDYQPPFQLSDVINKAPAAIADWWMAPRPPPDETVVFQSSKNPMVKFTQGDIDQATNLALGFSGGGLTVRAKPGLGVLADQGGAGYKVPHETASPITIAKAPVDVPGGVGGVSGGEESARQAGLQAERRAAGVRPLAGLPLPRTIIDGEPFVPGPWGQAHQVAEQYMAGRDFGVAHPDRFHPVDVEHAKAIANAYDQLPMFDPAALPSYEAMIRETLDQYRAITKSGAKFTPVDATTYPYHDNPRAAIKDLADNNHMAFFKTDEGFGTGHDTAHPLLRKSGERIGDYELLNNDLFRIVHDYFGHAKNGYGFRAAGEDNAWRAHAAMYSPEARPAMTTETRGQNSWLNYGPYGETNRTASALDTVFAPQKVALLPDWVTRDLPGTVQAPNIVSRANPSPDDIKAVLAAAREYGRKGWPTAEREVFKTTPEAYAETTALVPQVSIKHRLPGPLPGEELPNNARAAPIVANTDAIANSIAQRLEPLVRSDSPLLKFYHTGPVIRGIERYGEMPAGDAAQFMRDWSGQGAATSPRTQTPPNLRNSSFLMYERARGAPMTPERFDIEGNTPGFGMMGMHVDLADRFARGTENPWVNPKPFTFRENWSGNLRDVTGDTHNIRSTLYTLDQVFPGSLPRGWFTSDAAYAKYRSEGFQAVDPGDILDKLGKTTVKKIPRQSEYLPMTEPWYRAAEKLGIAPAEAQSGGWFSYGDITGLQSPPKTITNLLNDQIGATAKALNVSPEKVVNWWSRGKIPLAGIGGVAATGVMGDLARQDEYSP